MGKSSSGSSRPLTEEEKALYAQQTKSLQLADEVASKQFGFSQDDRKYMDQIFRGGADENSPEVAKAIADALTSAQESKKSAKPISLDEFTKNYVESSKKSGTSWFSNGKSIQDEYNKYTAGLKTTDALLSEAESEEIKNKVLEGFKDTSKSVDQMIFDSIKASDSKLSVALTDFADKTSAINAKFGAEATGISNQYINGMNELASTYSQKLDKVSSQYKTDANAATSKYGDYTEAAIKSFDTTTGRYQTAFEQASINAGANMGTADTDILSQQRGQALAGVSQAYKEAQDSLMSTLSRRGLAGSGVEAGALTQLAQGQAIQSSGALSQSYNQAIGLSDQRRLQQVGLTQGVAQQGIGVASSLLGAQQTYGGTALNAGLGVAQGVAGYGTQAAQGQYSSGVASAQAAYQSQMSLAETMRQLDTGVAQSQYQGTTANNQQNLANLAMGSGIASGIYSGASNMLAGAGSTANQSASIAGSTATSIGATDAQYRADQAANSGGIAGALIGGVAMAGAAYLGGPAMAAAKPAAGAAGAAGVVGSDKRLKTNIVRVGEENGYNIYTWDWIEGYDYGYNRGVLAQEVMEINPDAVILMDNGYYAVDYDMIGVSI